MASELINIARIGVGVVVGLLAFGGQENTDHETENEFEGQEIADHVENDNEEDRKMFVGGLPQDVSQDDLKDYFGQFGELENVQIVMDPLTGRSRGFAFLIYKVEESMKKAIENKDHMFKVKKVLCWHKGKHIIVLGEKLVSKEG